MKKSRLRMSSGESLTRSALIAFCLMAFLPLSLLLNYLALRPLISVQDTGKPLSIPKLNIKPAAFSNLSELTPEISLEQVDSLASLNLPAELSNLNLSPDGLNFAYPVIKENSLQALMVNGVQLGADYERIDFIAWSPKGDKLAVQAFDNGKAFVAVNGQAGKAYDWIFEPRFFSYDSRYFIYKARDSRGDFLVFNDIESGPYSKIYGPYVGGDRQSLLFYLQSEGNLYRLNLKLSK